METHHNLSICRGQVVMGTALCWTCCHGYIPTTKLFQSPSSKIAMETTFNYFVWT